MAERIILIGEVSRRTGCNIETIRYYERIGLMPLPPRRGRYRRYGAADVSRLAVVRRARELGFTLDEVRALLGLAAGGEASCAEARDLAAAHLHDVRSRIADLRRMERVLAATVSACDAGADNCCPLIAALSKPIAPPSGSSHRRRSSITC
jgi:MerR family mercuric resistance operon transcriptional regulator